MYKDQGKILCSATDLVHFLECSHLTSLDLINMETPLIKAPVDEQARLIGEKGSQHEKAFLQKLKQSGVNIADLSAVKGGRANRVKETLKAMESGAEWIYQGTLFSGNLTGQADFLKKVKLQTRFGDYGYEVMDAKLSHLPRVEFIIQLCFYADLLSEIQGAEPRLIHLIAGDGTELNFRTADFLRYYRFVKSNFLQKVTASPGDTYPDRCDYCTLCHWRELCKEKWLEDDHLNQVAGITRIQIKKLQNAGMNTMEALAKVNEGSKIPKMGDATLQKLKSQSGLQVEKRNSGENRFKILPLDPEGLRGFYRLPSSDDGDLFFDMEGDPLQTDGLEYLFGVYYLEKGEPRSREFWAHNRHEEKLAFEAFIDFVMARLKKHPGMSVYHYASYEETALKKLMSIHGTREAEVDHLLRSRKLVDLYKVVREGMMVSEPSYSLKNLEVFYMEKREGEVKDAGVSIVYYERWRETREEDLLKKIELYNQDDCRSLYLLREWLLKLRPPGIPWFTPDNEKEPRESDPVKSDLEERFAHYETSFLSQLPEDPGEWTADHSMRQLVFHLLDYYRREAKPAWWKLFSRQEMTVEELMEDPECIGGMRRDLTVKPVTEKRSLVYTYRFPEQEFKVKIGDLCLRSDNLETLGTLFDLDEKKSLAKLKINAAKGDIPDEVSIIQYHSAKTDVLQAAIFRIADSIIASDGKYRAIQSFLAKLPSRIKGHTTGTPVIDETKEILPQAIEAVAALDESYLFIQGPPGSGKTYTGSHLIVELLKRGYKVGVSSNSHKAINNLLHTVEIQAEKAGLKFKGVKKSTPDNSESHINGKWIKDIFDNGQILSGKPDLIAGTAWLFSRPEFDQALDYLFVDEAGQVSLANLTAIGTSARNIVLLGDQMQLGQPIQGSHPGRSGESSLEYLLDGEATIPLDQGIFLDTTHRMNEGVCRFISDAIYDGRLHPEEKNQNQRLVLGLEAHPELLPAGIRFIPMVHEGCSQKSLDEAEKVREIFLSLLKQSYIDRWGEKHPMTLQNIMVVAPYNLQVDLLKKSLPLDARVGTVDKFQGQEAEVVILSMATSSGEDLPRYMEFLYSKNRLNVAISRARCLALLVANPALMSVKCNTVEQMALVNALCWVKEYSDHFGHSKK